MRRKLTDEEIAKRVVAAFVVRSVGVSNEREWSGPLWLLVHDVVRLLKRTRSKSRSSAARPRARRARSAARRATTRARVAARKRTPRTTTTTTTTTTKRKSRRRARPRRSRSSPPPLLSREERVAELKRAAAEREQRHADAAQERSERAASFVRRRGRPPRGARRPVDSDGSEESEVAGVGLDELEDLAVHTTFNFDKPL
jgi:hypothetical protein